MLSILKRAEKFYKLIIILVDIALINLAIIIAFMIKFKFELPDFNFNPYLHASPFITIAALIFIDIYGLMAFYRKSIAEIVSAIIFVVILLSITTIAIAYLNQGFSFPRSVLLTAPFLQAIFLCTWHVFLLKASRYFADPKDVMIVGNKDQVNIVIEKVKKEMGKANANIKYILDPGDTAAILKRISGVQEVFVCSDISAEQKMEIISRCLGSKRVVYVVPQLFEISLLNSKLMQFDDIPAFMIDRLDLSIEQKFFKRLLDLVVSFIGIVITSPLMLVIAPIVKISSPGRIIYSQKRVTKDNDIFRIYKFRTMYDGVEKKTGPVISGRDDPRITPVGRVLRKLRLDELPQLFNVLKGDMSIVGPRPERPFFVEQFSKDIPEYTHRYVVKAGITGIAQVMGKYDTSAEDKLRYDLLYIKNYSLLMDIKIIFQTVKVMFTGSNVIEKSFYKNVKGSKAANF